MRMVQTRTWHHVGPLALSLAALAPGLVSEKGDTVLYASYAEQAWRGGHFFTQIPIEYPPLNALLFLLPQIFAKLGLGLTYYGAFLVLAATVDCLQRRALQRLASSPRQVANLVVLSAGCAAMLFYTYLKRFDIFAAAATTWMLTRLTRQPADLAAWALWALAVSCKLYPLTFAPLCLGYSYYQRTPLRRLAQQVAVGTAIVVGVHGFATWYGGAGAWAWLSYMRARGLQLASVYTALGILFEGLGHPLRVAYDFGCLQVYHPWSALCVEASPYLTLTSLAMTWRLMWASIRHGHGLWRGAAACVCALLITSKVFSPQYVIWLVPLLSAAATIPKSDRVLVVLTLALCASTALLFPFEIEIGQGSVLRQSVLLARSAVLLGIWGWLCRPQGYKPQKLAPEREFC